MNYECILKILCVIYMISSDGKKYKKRRISAHTHTHTHTIWRHNRGHHNRPTGSRVLQVRQEINSRIIVR